MKYYITLNDLQQFNMVVCFYIVFKLYLCLSCCYPRLHTNELKNTPLTHEYRRNWTKVLQWKNIFV